MKSIHSLNPLSHASNLKTGKSKCPNNYHPVFLFSTQTIVINYLKPMRSVSIAGGLRRGSMNEHQHTFIPYYSIATTASWYENRPIGELIVGLKSSNRASCK
jgi:hypothetical protein